MWVCACVWWSRGGKFEHLSACKEKRLTLSDILNSFPTSYFETGFFTEPGSRFLAIWIVQILIYYIVVPRINCPCPAALGLQMYGTMAGFIMALTVSYSLSCVT